MAQAEQLDTTSGSPRRPASRRRAEVSEAWRLAKQLQAALIQADLSDDESDGGYAALLNLEERVLIGVVTSRADAIAKLEAIAVCVDEDRIGDDHTTALAGVISWLRQS